MICGSPLSAGSTPCRSSAATATLMQSPDFGALIGDGIGKAGATHSEYPASKAERWYITKWR
jgi:hypothetical protein